MNVTMKKFILLAFAATFFVACGFLDASATTQKIERFAGQSITGVKASSAFDVTVSQATTPGATIATVEISDNLVDDLIFTIDADGVVRVGIENNGSKGFSNATIRLNLVCSSLQDIDLSGATKMAIEGTVSTPRLGIDMSGASKLTAKEAVVIDGVVDIEMSGATKAYLDNLTADRAEVDMSGASGLVIAGQAAQMKVEASGASKADCSKFVTRNTSCDVSSASHVSVNAVGSLTGEASSASSVVCFGGGRLNVRTSSAATVSSRK